MGLLKRGRTKSGEATAWAGASWAWAIGSPSSGDGRAQGERRIEQETGRRGEKRAGGGLRRAAARFRRILAEKRTTTGAQRHRENADLLLVFRTKAGSRAQRPTANGDGRGSGVEGRKTGEGVRGGGAGRGEGLAGHGAGTVCWAGLVRLGLRGAGGQGHGAGGMRRWRGRTGTIATASAARPRSAREARGRPTLRQGHCSAGALEQGH